MNYYYFEASKKVLKYNAGVAQNDVARATTIRK